MHCHRNYRMHCHRNSLSDGSASDTKSSFGEECFKISIECTVKVIHRNPRVPFILKSPYFASLKFGKV